MRYVQTRMDGLVNKLLFQPPGPLPSLSLRERRREMQAIKLPDATIYYIYFKTEGVSAYPGEPLTILYSHGNAEDLGSCYNSLRILSNLTGAHILAYDYCGYGFSKAATGSAGPSERRVYRDAEAVYGELTEVMGIPPSRLLLMGRSMGGGATCYLAEKYHAEIGGVILLSTFTSVLGALCPGCRFAKYLLCLRDPFPNKKHLREVGDCPFLIMHGTKDEVVRFGCAKQLLKKVKKAQSASVKKADVRFHWFRGCGHNDIEEREWNTLVKELKDFFVCVVTHHQTV